MEFVEVTSVSVLVLSFLYSTNPLLPSLLEVLTELVAVGVDVVVAAVFDLKAIIGEIGGGTCLPTK